MGEWIITTKMAKTNRLKPAHEPICMAQKPYEQCLDYNEKQWGVGYINVEDAENPLGQGAANKLGSRRCHEADVW